MRQQVMWAKLTNEFRSLLVASDDWTDILLLSADSCGPHDRDWSEADSAWAYSGLTARRLSQWLEENGFSACVGQLQRFGDSEFISATLPSLTAADGLTTQERTERLATFLSEGPFRWKYVMAPYTAPED
jgi:hypothetical protein